MNFPHDVRGSRFVRPLALSTAAGLVALSNGPALATGACPENDGCCALVCSIDPACCGDAWDAECMALAELTCEAPPFDRMITPEMVFILPGGAPGEFDIGVVVGALNATDDPLDLATDVSILVNGDLVASFPALVDPILPAGPDGACSIQGGCLSDPCPWITSPIGGAGASPGRCETFWDPAGNLYDCACVTLEGIDPGVGLTLLSGDEVTVVLSAAPGSALDAREANDIVMIDFVAAAPGDVDGDGIVSFSDLLAVLALWGPCAPPCIADLDFSGVVDFTDLLTVLSNWG